MIDLSRLEGEEKLFCAHIEDLISRCEHTYVPQYTYFLDERQAMIAEQILNREGWEDFLFWGGWADASRRMLGIFPPYSETDESQLPMQALTMTFRPEDKLTHRDFLGALMGLRIKRETVGDILIEEGKAVAFFSDTVVPLILSELKKVGSAGVKISDAPVESLPAAGHYDAIAGTVSSLRLDCVVSLATRLSREKSAQLIRSGLVTLEFVVCQHVDQTVKEGDSLSIRGYGKYKIGGSGGLSKKGRIRLTVFKKIT